MQLTLGGFSTVIMTDRWFQELRAGRTFGYQASAGPTAANNSHVQLLNPPASGKQAIVAQIKAIIGASGLAYLRRYDTAMTDVAALTNLLLGQADGVCHVRYLDNVGLLGSTIDTLYLLANTPTVIWPSWGPELSPGTGICVVPAAVNVSMGAEFLVNEV